MSANNETTTQPEESFPTWMWGQLGCYVYRLVDPTTKQTFYIGKGTGNRVFDHARGTDIKADSNAAMSLKKDVIERIRKDGLTVEYIIHRHGMDDEQAFHVEAALIDAYPELTNLQTGHGAYTVGMMKVRDVVRQYGLPEFPQNPDHKLVLIKIAKLPHHYDEKDIFRLTRYCWPISHRRASQADYVIAVHRGRSLAAYKADVWLPATAENFRDPIPNSDNEGIPYADDTEKKRYGFHGSRAPKDIWDKYVGQHGKAFTERKVLRAQFPILYIGDWGS